MAAAPNKAVSPKDYTVCVGRQTNKSALDPGNLADLLTYHSLINLISKYSPSYSIVGEFIIAYPQSRKDLTIAQDYYINCVYIFDDSLLNKCRYIRLVIIPDIYYTNRSSLPINVVFNVEMQCGSSHSESIELFQKLLPKGVTFFTWDKKYAVIYDLEKNEIYNDTDDPIEEWSDSNQLEIYE